MNILANAIKFTEKSALRQISVRTSVVPVASKFVFLEMVIKDTGVGMTEAEQAIMFQRFSQTSMKTFHEYGGSGLGLYISIRLVYLMEGNVLVYTQNKM
jgi:signal transduction histidine kinase